MFSKDFSSPCSCGGAFVTLQDRAHTALVYGSRYLQRQSNDNGETSWYDMLMKNMISISCRVTVTEMLELQHGNTIADDR
jgi:hypothetical protein